MRRLIAITAAVMTLAAGNSLAPATADVPPRDHVQVLAINDFHGNLEPAGEAAPGAAYLAAELAALRHSHARTITVGAGDLVGGSPLASSLLGDQPALAALDAMQLRYSAVGNHEFDRGRVHLQRLARGARLRYLAANVRRAGGRTLFPAARLATLGGVRVGFVGVTLRDTPAVTAPGGTAGLRFGDEATAIRRAAQRLRRRGASAVVALVHQGGEQHPPYANGVQDPSGCEHFRGPLVGIVRRLAGTVDAVASGHTHGAYVCRIAGIPVTAAGSYGRLVTEYDLGVDRRSGGLVSVSAQNVQVTHELAPDPAVQAIVDRAVTEAAPVADRVLGEVAEPLPRPKHDRTPLGTVIADAERDAVPGADAALVNPGGIRADLDAGAVTYADLFAVLPFGYELREQTLTGAQLARVLEQQFRDDGDCLLQLSSGLTYERDGDHVTALALDGAPITADQPLRVVANAFLATGRDGFTAFRDGREPAGGPGDIDALARYVGGHFPTRSAA